jgi:mRNA-degrading endonuclease RelE of RelBE toxin-antitoxin system
MPVWTLRSGKLADDSVPFAVRPGRHSFDRGGTRNKLVNFDIYYRLRVGNYRVFFEREDVLKIIDVVDILPRKKSY